MLFNTINEFKVLFI